MTSEQRTAADSDQGESCERLFELYIGATGPVYLGRLLCGKQAGRLVMLRPVSAERGVRVTALVDRVRHISHPKLLKLLGCFRIGAQDYLASEYIAGVSFVELSSKLTLSSVKDVAVLVRIVRDVLLAAHSGRRLLHGLYGRRVERCIFPDTIWVAEFGEVFITELAVFEALVGDGALSVVRSEASLEPEAPLGRADVLATGQLLFDALSNRNKQDEALLGLPSQTSKALAAAVSRALEHDGHEAFASATELAHALSNLPSGLQASTDDVRSVLGQALQGVLELRRRKLSLVEQTSAVTGDNEATQFHRASGLNRSQDVDTVRPSAPSGSGTHPTLTVPSARLPSIDPRSEPTRRLPRRAIAASASSGAAPKRSVSEDRRLAPQRAATLEALDSEDATLLFKPARVGTNPMTPFDDDATRLWSGHASQPRLSMDEDATALYVASKQRPAEPSVIVQDHDDSELYLRARTDVSGVRGTATDEPTRLSVRASKDRDPQALQRRRSWLSVLLFMALLLLSMGVTLFVTRSMF